MGLGIKATYPISFRKMAEQIHDVMEAVDYCTFERLQRFQYPSLYKYDDNNKILICLILLFGLLALCNSNIDNPVGFEHFYQSGVDLLLK